MRDMSLSFSTESDGGTSYNIASYYMILGNVTRTPRQPIYNFVEVPGRAYPLDLSRAASGQIAWTREVLEFELWCLSSSETAATIYSSMQWARAFERAVNGKRLYVHCSDVAAWDETFYAEVSVTSVEYVGEYVKCVVRCQRIEEV